jgi:hypothetical protein
MMELLRRSDVYSYLKCKKPCISSHDGYWWFVVVDVRTAVSVVCLSYTYK